MDGLIILLIIVGIISKLSKKNPTKRRRNAAPATRQDMPWPTGAIPFTKEELDSFLEGKRPRATAKPEAQPAAPVVKPAAERMRPAAPTVKASAPQAAPQNAASKAVPQPLLYLANDEPEGTVSTQGESAAEHAAHRDRILAEETQLEQEEASLRELRSANLQKLRSAVVMSEVLGKPVALRNRRR